MCFSTEASFTAGSILLISGIVSVKKSTESKQLFFASIPVIFAVQQFSEGFLWLSFTGDNPDLQKLFTYMFLLFAHVIWPVWVPLSYRMIENNERKKRILSLITVIGSLVSVYLCFCMFYYPVDTNITDHHIHYDLNYPDLHGIGKIFYFIPTMLPPFISGVRWMWALGSLNLISFLISFFLFKDHVISVWCYMAAIISAVVLLIMMKVVGKK
jgi:hypothetical protein